MKDVSDDVMFRETSEECELVELGDVSDVTKGPGFGPYSDANGWPKPFL